ncbi:MAG TPA: DsbA family protein [Solirubrobacterales bacterium]|nr:DsbA family protein [Solirubrobacterales bacterium]
MQPPTLYYDLGSPYAHLAVARAAGVLGVEPRLQPVLVGGLFVERGWGSWSQTPARTGRIEEIEARAKRYGLPPLRWPEGWPNNTLKAMRAAVWAEGLGRGADFARAGFRLAFAEGADLSRREVLERVAREVELPAEEMLAAIEDQTIKERLRAATAEAWERGVTGVPSIGAGGKVFFGDDRLELAALACAA